MTHEQMSDIRIVRAQYYATLLTPIEGAVPVHINQPVGVIHTADYLTHLELTEPAQEAQSA